MKEWTIRIACVLLGVFLTIGIENAYRMTVPKINDKESEVEINEYIEPVVDTVPEDVVSEEEKKQNEINEEAKQKYDDLMEGIVEQQVIEDVVDNGVPENSIDAAPVNWKREPATISSTSSLEEHLMVRSSYDETMAVNAFDKMVIENSTVDFSNVKITVIGDSISQGNTLPEEEQEKYNWPAQMKEILGCKEVVNLAIGGSTVSRCTDNYSIVDRWGAIDKDSDIIIVFAGSNDCLFMNKWDYGELEYEHRMNSGTFCGDLDEMCGGMKWTYTDHNDENYCKLFYINPPSTILNDAVYNINPVNMVKQEKFAEAINVIAPSYGFDVIDMYNNNILNSHDADINALYVYDGIHCNKEGYTIMAEHIASQIIQRIEQ